MEEAVILFAIKNSALNRGMNTGLENLAWGIADKGYTVHILSGGETPHSHTYSVPKSVTYHFTGDDGSPADLLNTFVDLWQRWKYRYVIGWVRNIVGMTLLPIYTSNSRPVFIANQGSTDIRKRIDTSFGIRRRIKLCYVRLREKRMPIRAAVRYVIKPLSYYQSIDLIVGNSRSVTANAKDTYGVPEEKCRVVHRSVDSGFFTPSDVSDKMSRNSINKRIRIIHTGLIDERKGVADVAKALRFVHEPVEFVLCGPEVPHYSKKLFDYLEDCDEQEHRMIFTGPVSREVLREEYLKSDIFVLCSYSEGFSKSLLEAMSCGLAVVVSDIPPFREIIEDHINGLMVPTGSANEIAGALNEYCVDIDLRTKCGENARRTIINKFDKEKEISAWINILHENTFRFK